MRTKLYRAVPTALILALSVMTAGCAATSKRGTLDPADPHIATLKSTERTRATWVPKVQECGIVAISSPPKYVCGGKVYTATQLAKIRNDEAKKYQSGQ